MEWPGEDIFKEWVEQLASEVDERVRKDLKEKILSTLMDIIVKCVTRWWNKKGRIKLPLDYILEDYYNEVLVVLYQRIIGWVHGSTVDRKITLSYLWRTIEGIAQDKFMYDLEKQTGDSLELIDEMPAKNSDISESVVRRDSFEKFWGRLTKVERDVLRRKGIEGQSMTEIAGDMGCSVSKISRDCAKILKLWQKESLY